MSFSFAGHRGSASSKTSGAVLSVAPNAPVPAGAILVAVAISDNLATGGGPTKNHVVTDFQGNRWEKVREQSNAAAAGAGITLSAWLCQVTAPLGTSDAIVLGLTAAVAARAIGLYEYGVDVGNSVRVAGSAGSEQDNTASPAVTLSGPESAAYALFGVIARENDDAGTYAQDPDYNDRTKFGTTGGTAATNVSAIVGDRLATLAGDTFAPTALASAADVAAILVAFQEVDVTTEQLNAGKAVVLNSLFLDYPAVRGPAIRVAIGYLKNGTPKEQQVAKALLQQAYQAIHGVDPVGVHDFIHWVRDLPLQPLPDDPTQGVGPDDAFEAVAQVVA